MPLNVNFVVVYGLDVGTENASTRVEVRIMNRITSGKVIAVLALAYAALMVYSAVEIIGGMI